MLRLSLRTKLVLYALLVLAPVLVLLLAAFEASADRRREIVLDSMVQTAEAVAVVADVSFDEAMAVGRGLASDPDIQSLDPDRIVPRLRHLAPLYPEYNNLTVLDAAGNLRGESAASDPGVPRNVADRAFFQRVLATGEPTTIEVVLSRRTGQPATGVAIPFFGADDDLRGIVTLSFDLDRLRARLERVGLLPGQALGLIDPSGHLAISSEPVELPWDQRDLSTDPGIWPFLRAAMDGQIVRTTAYRRASDTEPRALALVPTPTYGWLIALRWPTEQAFAPAEEARRQELAIFGVITVVSLIGAVILASYLAQPVRRLAAHTNAIGRGELDRRVEIRTGDELQQLGEAFNAMVGRLHLTLDQLRAARESAEARRAQAEAARAAAQRAVGVRDDFLASASHDLRTPLAHIKGFVSTLRQTDVEWDHATRDEFLAEIERETDRLAKLIGDLLDMTRLESGELDRLERAPVRPADLVAGGIDRVRGQLDGRPVIVQVPDTLPPVDGDAAQLERVLANLVENAVKYGREGTAVRIVGSLAGDELELSVEDEGPGISPKDRERIFDKFVRLRAEPTLVAGTGLGLAICRRIVEAHGGRISTENHARGARFVVRLPLVVPARVGGADARSANPGR